MRFIIVVLACLYFYTPAFCQDNYLQTGDDCFDNGDYECAISNYKSHQAISGQNVSTKIEKAETCFKTRILADGYFKDEELEKAGKKYEEVLRLNPRDSYVRRQYNICTGGDSSEPASTARTAIPPDVLKVSSSVIKAATRPETYNVTITSNVSWKVSSSESWCKVAPLAWSNNGDLSITVDGNDSGRLRTAVVTITVGNSVLDIRVNQHLVEIEMVFIEGGSFMMGSPDDEPEKSYEEKLHKVTLSSFQMGKYEVTQKQWVDIMGKNPSRFIGDDLPVENVRWTDVQLFITKLNQFTGRKYRLPTEAEWEYACRAGTTTPFNTGYNLTTNQANYNGGSPYNGNPKGDYLGKSTQVGSYPPNAWGLYDMHGNVEEWCEDLYGSYSVTEQIDPKGPSLGSERVVRGGTWISGATYCRASYRSSDYSSNNSGSLMGGNRGFRLCL